MASTLTQLLGKGRALRPLLKTNQSQVAVWLKEVTEFVDRSSSLSKDINVGIYLSQFQHFPEDGVRLDRLINALEEA